MAQRLIPRTPTQRGKWRLWQVETAIACNLTCVMCPWAPYREGLGAAGYMRAEVWGSLRSHLTDVTSIDFSGGGEPVLQPRLAEWISEAKRAGCRTGFSTNGTLLTSRNLSRIVEAGTDWICFSVDGATADVYERIRPGADFGLLCETIQSLIRDRSGKCPLALINFVILKQNSHQLEDMARLAARLGVDQLNFKHCDVIRGDCGGGLGVFSSQETKETRRMARSLAKARRIARRHGVETTSFSFTPSELPFCAQDPRGSVFIRCDGTVAPCISLAYGGRSKFLGEPVRAPEVHYGKLPEADLSELWESEVCRSYRDRLDERLTSHDAAIANSHFERSLPGLGKVLRDAVNAMPDSPEGCSVCHYLYDV